VSLRMLTNHRLAYLRLTTAQQRTTGQSLPSDLYLRDSAVMSQSRGLDSSAAPACYVTLRYSVSMYLTAIVAIAQCHWLSLLAVRFGVRFSAETRDVYLFCIVHTGSWAHLASFEMSNMISLSRGKSDGA
jgi:hypothetical protein